MRESFSRRAQPRKRVKLSSWPPPGTPTADTWLKPGWSLDHMADFMEKLEEAEREEPA